MICHQTHSTMSSSKLPLWSTALPSSNLKKKDHRPKLLFWSTSREWVSIVRSTRVNSTSNLKSHSVLPERECPLSYNTKIMLHCLSKEPLRLCSARANNGLIVLMAKLSPFPSHSRASWIRPLWRWLKTPWELYASGTRNWQPVMISRLRTLKESSILRKKVLSWLPSSEFEIFLERKCLTQSSNVTRPASQWEWSLAITSLLPRQSQRTSE